MYCEWNGKEYEVYEYGCSIPKKVSDVQGSEIYTQYSAEKLGDKAKTLSSITNLPENASIYEIFSYFYETGDADVSELEMVWSILGYKYTETDVYCMYALKDGVYDFTWFSRGSGLLGSYTFNGVFDKNVKVLRYKMLLSGCNFQEVQYITWGTDCKTTEIQKYFRSVETISDKVCVGYYDLVRKLSMNLKVKYEFSSKEFVTSLEQGLPYYKDNKFIKDYSSCYSTSIDKTRGKWGIILDCEGNRNNESGLRELGGIIFCRYGDILINVETFECTEVLLEETLTQVIKNYESDTGRYIPSWGIDIFTYGGVDESMIESSLRQVSNKKFRRKIKKLFRYHDCRDFIENYVDMQEKHTLSNVAEHLGVFVVKPKHSALADARTLFNVLAFILESESSWVLNNK